MADKTEAQLLLEYLLCEHLMNVGSAELATRVQRFCDLPEDSKFRSLCLKYRAHKYLVGTGIIHDDEDIGPCVPFMLPNLETQPQGKGSEKSTPIESEIIGAMNVSRNEFPSQSGLSFTELLTGPDHLIEETQLEGQGSEKPTHIESGPSSGIDSEKAKWYKAFWKGVTDETQRKPLFVKELCDTSVMTSGARFTVPKSHTVCFPALIPGRKASVQIQDPTEQKWSITCTMDKTSKAYQFREGWAAFVTKHNLKASDKLAFSIDRDNILYVNW